jgi:formamidopyrimidine-DNA glycosylase
VTRRAKYFILHLSESSLLIHLRMSGDLSIKNSTISPKNMTDLYKNYRATNRFSLMTRASSGASG